MGVSIYFGRSSILEPNHCLQQPQSVCPVPLFSLSPALFHFLSDTYSTVQQPFLHSVTKAPGSSVHRCRTAGQHPTGPGCWNRRDKPAHMQNYNASISHTDIIPMFYLSPCNSFYILGLCSLASIQSQPRDTGLYQAHMCALLQLTHISSFVTVTKLARLSWEMCRLWLAAHVWILYFESHADLSNMGSVKASFTLLSSTGTTESCRRFAALTTCVRITLLSVCVCMCAWSRECILSHTLPFLRVAFTKAQFQKHVAGIFLLFLSTENPKGKNVSETFFMLAFWQDCLREREEKKGRLVYPDQISH